MLNEIADTEILPLVTRLFAQELIRAYTSSDINQRIELTGQIYQFAHFAVSYALASIEHTAKAANISEADLNTLTAAWKEKSELNWPDTIYRAALIRQVIIREDKPLPMPEGN